MRKMRGAHFTRRDISRGDSANSAGYVPGRVSYDKPTSYVVNRDDA